MAGTVAELQIINTQSATWVVTAVLKFSFLTNSHDVISFLHGSKNVLPNSGCLKKVCKTIFQYLDDEKYPIIKSLF